MTTLEELLTMMAEDAARAAAPDKQPPPVPPRKAEAIGAEDLDDGPVLKDRLWPSALPRPARRGPPPPPPGRRARGTAPLGETVNSGLIDVRAMAMAYQAEAARRSAEEAAVAAAVPESPPELAESSATVKIPEPPVEAEAAPTPIIAEGTRPIAPVTEEISESEPEPEQHRRAGLWLMAGRAAVVFVLGGTAAAAVTVLVNRARSEGAASDPTNYTARVAATEPAAEAPMPELAAPVAQPAVEPIVIVEPTTITEVASEPAAQPALAGDVVDSAPTAPAVDPSKENADNAEQPGPGHPPPELLADGCFDAACSATATPVRRPRRAAEMIAVPARLPVRPSNSEIASTIFSAQDQIEGCGAVYGMTGQVPLKINIAASGAITQVAVGEGTTRFRTCVSDIVKRLKMPASVVGTSASFPVLLR